MKRSVILIVPAALAAYFCLWPVPIDPVAWQAPANPGYPRNDLLRGVESLPAGPGPEDVAMGLGGALYTGLQDGRIVRLPGGQTFVNTGGRPLGMQFDAQGNLIVADAFRGLLSISPAGAIAVLAGGMVFPNDLDIARDGTVWFTDSSRRFDQLHYMLDFWEGRPTGRLLAYNPVTRETSVRLDGLCFSNGVALGPDEDYVLVCETLAARITRLWLKGPRAGRSEVFIDALPGYPDNLSYNGKGIFWVALPVPRVDALDRLSPRPFLRKVLFRLPQKLRDPRPAPYGWVLGIDPEGKVIRNLQGTAYGTITSVNEFDGRLYFGSIAMPAVGRY